MIHFIKGIRYVEVAKSKMLPQVLVWFLDGGYIFMLDKATCDRAWNTHEPLTVS